MKGSQEQTLKAKMGEKVESEAKIAQNYYINQINISNLKNSLKKQLNEDSFLESSGLTTNPKGEKRQDSNSKPNKTRTNSK